MVRFATIGTNFITERFLEALGRLKGAVLTTVYSRDKARADSFADRFAAPYRFDDLGDLAAAGSFDAVYIASPNTLHYEQAARFLDAGKHVLCEKPLVLRMSQAADLFKRADAAGVVLMEAMRPTCTPSFARLRENLPALGPLRYVSFQYAQYSSRYDRFLAEQDPVPNAFLPAFGGGALTDLGVYGLAPLLRLYGRPAAVKALHWKLSTGVAGVSALLLAYEGFLATVAAAKVCDSRAVSELMGEKGNITIAKLSAMEDIVLYDRRTGVRKTLSVPHEPNDMVYEIEEFLRTLQEGRSESVLNPRKLSEDVVWVLEAAQEEAAQMPNAHGAD